MLFLHPSRNFQRTRILRHHHEAKWRGRSHIARYDVVAVADEVAVVVGFRVIWEIIGA